MLPLTMMKPISRLAATGFRANQAIMPLTVRHREAERNLKREG